MNAKLARTIITQALNDETWEGDVPEDDGKAIEEAGEVVKMAEDAWEQGVKGPEVEAILKLAASAEDEDDEPAPVAKAKPGRPKPAAAGAAEPDPQPEVEEPWDDYLSNSVGEVKEGIEAWAQQEEWEALRGLMAFEEANKNRVNVVKSVLKFLPDAELPVEPAPDPEPEPEVEADPAADLPHSPAVEPFEGYSDLTVKEVKESLNDFMHGEDSEDVEDEDKLATLKQVRDHESVTRGRAGLLDYLDENIAVYSQEDDPGVEDDQAGAEAEAGSAEDTAPSEDDAGDEDSPAPSKVRGKKAGAASGKGSSSRATAGAASSTPDSSRGSFLVTYTDVTGEEYEVQQIGKFAVAGMVVDMLESGCTSVKVDAS